MTYGRIICNQTYAGCARVTFKIMKDGEDSFDIEGGVLYLWRNEKLIRVVNNFDMDIRED